MHRLEVIDLNKKMDFTQTYFENQIGLKNHGFKEKEERAKARMYPPTLSFVTKSQRLDDVEPLYGFNVVASFGPFIAGQYQLKDNQRMPSRSIIKSAYGRKNGKNVRKQVRFSDRLLCRQFVKTQEEKNLEEDKGQFNIFNRIISRQSFSKKKREKSKQIVKSLKLIWYLESEYSLSNVSGLYPEEIAALNRSYSVKQEPFVIKKLSDCPIPEEDELEDDFSIYSDSLTIYENSLTNSDELMIGGKNNSCNNISSSRSTDSGYKVSEESSLENLKEEEYCRLKETSLIESLYERAQSQVERNIADSLSRMNIPEWALSGIKLTVPQHNTTHPLITPAIMSQSDHLDPHTPKHSQMNFKKSKSSDELSIVV